jgi:CO/xanthine dehydrogenase FAD-binding subunit
MLYNLREIHHPTDIDEAVRLLSRKDVRTVAMAGGTSLVGEGGPEIEAAVDLDGLGLDKIEGESNAITLGATVRLQTIVDELRDEAGGLLAESARQMAGWHVRNAATVGGALFTAPSSAPLLPVLAALGTEAVLYAPGETVTSLLDFLRERKAYASKGALLAAVQFEIPSGAAGFAYADVGRTPADDPIVCAVARVQDDEERVWLGGVGPNVVAVVGDDVSGLPEPPSDFLGSADYRAAMAGVLARRALGEARERAGSA